MRRTKARVRRWNWTLTEVAGGVIGLGCLGVLVLMGLTVLGLVWKGFQWVWGL